MVCDNRKSKFIKEQEARKILSSLGIMTGLDKIPILCNILFKMYKMNQTMHKFFLAGDKVMSEMHLRQAGCTYSPCRNFSKNKERIQKFKETGDSK